MDPLSLLFSPTLATTQTPVSSAMQRGTFGGATFGDFNTGGALGSNRLLLLVAGAIAGAFVLWALR